ncbi:DUF6088 family protein [Listeria booriae]|uniref:DUF6088 family protein n=1 Tax=Listeria booriae TaxID=1552123 RepID=UPI00162454B1|nr:DUF6088 family protein [Listeria booriae]MBC2326300.1 hypothetical protein [Listeria booriae]
MGIRDVLLREFGYEEPIVANNMGEQAFGMSRDSLRRSMNRLVARKELARFAEGIYYFPKWSELLQQETLLSERVVIERKYVEDKNKRYGYFSGGTFANQIQLTTQVPYVQEIVTMRCASKKRNVTLKVTQLLLRKPRVPVTPDNYKVLQVLDLLTEHLAFVEVGRKEMNEKVREYLADVTLSNDEVIRIISEYPSKTSKELLESGLLDALIRK